MSDRQSKKESMANSGAKIDRPELGSLFSCIESIKSRLSVGRAGHPDEVTHIALVLARDLPSYVHGALTPVDGGFLLARETSFSRLIRA